MVSVIQQLAEGAEPLCEDVNRTFPALAPVNSLYALAEGA